MKSVARMPKRGCHFRCPVTFNEIEIILATPRIELVPNDGMTKVRKVHANLMRPARERPGPYDRKEFAIRSLQPLLNSKTGMRRGTFGVHRPFEINFRRPDLAKPENRFTRLDFLPVRPAEDESEVFLPNAALLHREAGVASSRGVLGDEHNAAGLAIEAIDEGDLPARRELVAEQIAQAIPERARAAGFGGMHEEPCGFVDGEKVGRLTEHGKIGAHKDALPRLRFGGVRVIGENV